MSMPLDGECRLGRTNRHRLVMAFVLTPVLVALAVSSPSAARAEDPAPAAVDVPDDAVAPTPEATPASATQASATQAPAANERRTGGLIPGVLIGPKVGISLLFPPNLMVGVETKVMGYVGASFEYGVFPKSRHVDEYDVAVESWSAGLRAYPFRGSFFVGAVLGKYDVTATESAGSPAESKLQVKSTYLGPQIGWKWDFDVGLFLGFNLGYGFALDYSSVLTPLGGSGDLQDAKKNADKYLKSGVPTLTLFELGWLF